MLCGRPARVCTRSNCAGRAVLGQGGGGLLAFARDYPQGRSGLKATKGGGGGLAGVRRGGGGHKWFVSHSPNLSAGGGGVSHEGEEFRGEGGPPFRVEEGGLEGVGIAKPGAWEAEGELRSEGRWFRGQGATDCRDADGGGGGGGRGDERPVRVRA